jgi:hypothetical protein
MFSNIFSKIVSFMIYNLKKNCSRAGEATDDNMARAHFTLWIGGY